jgi:hypothetical protein
MYPGDWVSGFLISNLSCTFGGHGISDVLGCGGCMEGKWAFVQGSVVYKVNIGTPRVGDVGVV